MDIRAAQDAPLFCDACPVGRHSLYGPIHTRNAGEVTAMRSLRRNFLPGQTILRDGDVPATVYTLFSGWAFRFKMLPDGGRHILGFYLPGDFISPAALDKAPLPYAVRALTAVHVCGFDRQTMADRVSVSLELQSGLIGQLLQRKQELDGMLIDIARRPAELRLLRFLVAIGEKLKARNMLPQQGFDLPVPQAILADALGVTPVYLNRMLVALRERGVVEIARKHILVPDPERLAELADEAVAA